MLSPFSPPSNIILRFPGKLSSVSNSTFWICYIWRYYCRTIRKLDLKINVNQNYLLVSAAAEAIFNTGGITGPDNVSSLYNLGKLMNHQKMKTSVRNHHQKTSVLLRKKFSNISHNNERCIQPQIDNHRKPSKYEKVTTKIQQKT